MYVFDFCAFQKIFYLSMKLKYLWKHWNITLASLYLTTETLVRCMVRDYTIKCNSAQPPLGDGEKSWSSASERERERESAASSISTYPLLYLRLTVPEESCTTWENVHKRIKTIIRNEVRHENIFLNEIKKYITS